MGLLTHFISREQHPIRLALRHSSLSARHPHISELFSWKNNETIHCPSGVQYTESISPEMKSTNEAAFSKVVENLLTHPQKAQAPSPGLEKEQGRGRRAGQAENRWLLAQVVPSTKASVSLSGRRVPCIGSTLAAWLWGSRLCLTGTE